MSIGGVSAFNGIFTITDAGGTSRQVDLGTLMMMLNIDRTNNIDQQIAAQLDEITQRNALLGELTEFMSLCRSLKAGERDDGCANGALSSDGEGKLTINGVTKSIQGSGGWAETFGIAWSDVDGYAKVDVRSASWDANINAIKGKIDTLNNDSQMDNIKLQNLLEKRNNAFEMATKVMDSNNQSIQSTLRNL